MRKPEFAFRSQSAAAKINPVVSKKIARNPKEADKNPPISGPPMVPSSNPL